MAGRRDRWLAGGLLALLLALTVAAAARQSGEEQPPAHTVASSAPEGARALLLWLEALGYQVDAKPPAAFRVPADAGVVLLLEPSQAVSPGEWELIDAWVEDGGTLILAGSGFGSSTAFLHYDFHLARLAEAMTPAAQGPWLRSPTMTDSPVLQARAYLSPGQTEYLPVLAADGRLIVARIVRGAGQVLLCSAVYPFSNAGLKDAGNPSLALSLISAAPEPRTIWFDEWHHGLRPAQASIVGPGNWLRYTPAGRAVIYTAAVLFLALVLRGRHFGRPEPLPDTVRRRGPADYVTAIANLGRRARHRGAVLQRYRHELKRALGARFHLDPLMPDDDYARLLALMNPQIDAEQLDALLRRLRRPDVSERELIELAATAARWHRAG